MACERVGDDCRQKQKLVFPNTYLYQLVIFCILKFELIE